MTFTLEWRESNTMFQITWITFDIVTKRRESLNYKPDISEKEKEGGLLNRYR